MAQDWEARAGPPRAHPGAMPPTRYWYRWRKKGPPAKEFGTTMSATKNCVAGGAVAKRVTEPELTELAKQPVGEVGGYLATHDGRQA